MNLDTKTKCLSGGVDTIDIKKRENFLYEKERFHI